MVDVPRRDPLQDPSNPIHQAKRLRNLADVMTPRGMRGGSRWAQPVGVVDRQRAGARSIGGRSNLAASEKHHTQRWLVEDDTSTTFILDFEPSFRSWNVTCGYSLVDGVDYEIHGATLTILDPAVTFVGASPTYPKRLAIQYDYLAGVKARPVDNGYFELVMAANPLGYWRLGEASGTTMTDSSGNGRDGTYFNGPTLGEPSLLTADPDTAAFFADATHEYGAVASASWMNTSEVTAMAVIEPHNVSSDRGILSRTSYPTGVLSWHFNVSGQALQFTVWIGGTPHTASTASVLDTVSGGTFRAYHVAATYDGATILIYLDGVQVATLAQTGAPDTGTAQISVGRTKFDVQADGNQWFEGVIDEAAVFGVALDAADIAVIAAAR